jgi:hypothetical protein
MDQRWIDGEQVLAPHLHPVQRLGAVVGDEHVCLAHQGEQPFPVSLGAEVEREPALAVIPGGKAVAERAEGIAVRRLDLDHVSAHIRQQPPHVRTGDVPGQLHYPQPGEGQGSGLRAGARDRVTPALHQAEVGEPSDGRARLGQTGSVDVRVRQRLLDSEHRTGGDARTLHHLQPVVARLLRHYFTDARPQHRLKLSTAHGAGAVMRARIIEQVIKAEHLQQLDHEHTCGCR